MSQEDLKRLRALEEFVDSTLRMADVEPEVGRQGQQIMNLVEELKNRKPP